jgi:hypothetical protein
MKMTVPQRVAATEERNRQCFRLVRDAVEQWPQFDGDEEVGGADMVEWFCNWRERAKEILSAPTR